MSEPIPLPKLPAVEHRFATVAGVRLHYAEAGAGEPLVLQHGWTQHWWMWRHLIGPLAERYRVIAPDLRGFGWSDKPLGGYRKDRLRDDLLGLLDAIGVERFSYVGHDWGAHLGILMALHAPQRIRRQVLVGFPLPWQLRLRRPREFARYWYIVVLNTPGLGYLAPRRLRLTTVALRWGRDRGRWTPEEIAAYESVGSQPAAARAQVRLYREWLLREALPFVNGGFRRHRLTVPTHWMAGEHDAVCLDDDGSWRDYADDMTAEYIRGVGHYPPEECPDLLLQRILDFIGTDDERQPTLDRPQEVVA